MRSSPLARRAGGEIRFVSMSAAETGVDFRNVLRAENIKKYLYNGAGVAIGDVDGDGLPDVYLVCQDGPNALYRQLSPFRFENVTVASGVMGGDAWGAGASFADVDGDGDLDLHVCNTGAPDLLYVNRGDGRFDERAHRAGIAHSGAGTMGAWADYDRDGDLDLYLLTNRVFSVAEETGRVKARKIDGELTVHPDFRDQYDIIHGRFIEAGQRDVLFRNEGDGTFTDVADAAGIEGWGMGLSATWWDIDDDGWLDLYVANDLKTRDRLYRNERDGTFADVLTDALPYTSWFSMGSDVADVDGDGRLDLLVGDMSARTHYKAKVNMGDMSASAWFLDLAVPRQYMRNTLFLNTGTERFMEVASLAGIASTDWTWSLRFGDLDNDRREDIFITTGMERNANDGDWAMRFAALMEEGRSDEASRLLGEMPRLPEANLVYRNLGELTFEEVGAAWGLDHVGVSHGAAFSDLDRDGDLDIVVNNLNETALIYRNDGGRGNAVLLRLEGRGLNRFGIGARLEIESASGHQVRLLTTTRGYLSADEAIVHVGIGDDLCIDRLVVDWPSGTRQRLSNLAAGRLHVIAEPSLKPTAPANEPSEPPVRRWFEDATAASGLLFRHEERPYDDFAREPLLPSKLSQLGPGLAWSDADDDGDDDLYVGGAAGQSGALYLRTADGAFERADPAAWAAATEAEDMGALWFDADSDGDLDLYVVSGGVECEAGDAVLEDRLYLNDGTALLTPAPPGALPDLRDAGSSVTAADLERDGDLDLFVGSRVVPGRYPEPPPGRLLRNDGGRFTDVSASIGGFAELGLVTGAVWSDLDGNGYPDLAIAREWGSIAIFLNRNGKLEPATDASGLGSYRGWWNGVAAGDVDGDGDMDLVGGNFGLNTKYDVSRGRPAELFCADFDGDGRMDLVEGKHAEGRLLPVRGRSCSSGAMPFIAERFPTFHSFGFASLEEIYGAPALERSFNLEIDTLESGVFLNDGNATFVFRPFPRLAQAAPAFGVVVSDLDGDGEVDVYLAQNFYTPQRETGRLAGGLGALLEGLGDGTFRFVPSDEVGVVVPEDAKGAALADVDGDGWPDIVLTTNDDGLRVLRNTGTGERAPLTLRLRGSPGNPTAVGARVAVVGRNGTRRSAEISAGSGYLSQGFPAVTLALPGGEAPLAIEIRWPDGHETTLPGTLDGPIIERTAG